MKIAYTGTLSLKMQKVNKNYVDLPDDGPEIRGGQPRYNIGDNVNVTCISRNSLPAAKLSWYINGEKADPIYLRTYPEETNVRTGLQTSTLGLTFKVKIRFRKFKTSEWCIKWTKNGSKVNKIDRWSDPKGSKRDQIWTKNELKIDRVRKKVNLRRGPEMISLLRK